MWSGEERTENKEERPAPGLPKTEPSANPERSLGGFREDGDARPYPRSIPGGAGFLDPRTQGAAPPRRIGGALPGASVAEIHAYPSRPRRFQGRTELVRPREAQDERRCSWGKRRVIEILDRWREVGEWWNEERATDKLVFRVLLSSGTVVNLARERSGGWYIVGVVD